MGKFDGMGLFKKYFWVTTIPTFFGYCIYADYSHTQKWKAGKQSALDTLSNRQLQIKNSST